MNASFNDKGVIDLKITYETATTINIFNQTHFQLSMAEKQEVD